MYDYRDLAERAAFTAVETALAVVVAAGSGWVDVNVWKAAAISGVAAGLSAVKTWFVQRRSA
jgi:hypothetical protein